MKDLLTLLFGLGLNVINTSHNEIKVELPHDIDLKQQLTTILKCCYDSQYDITMYVWADRDGNPLLIFKKAEQ